MGAGRRRIVYEVEERHDHLAAVGRLHQHPETSCPALVCKHQAPWAIIIEADDIEAAL